MSAASVPSNQPKTAVPQMHPRAFLRMARQYHEAAEVLFAEHERRINAGNKSEIDDPIYFMYYHTIELAFKTYRRAHNLPNVEHHRLIDLYADCQKLGLVLGPPNVMQNIVNWLQSSDKEFTRFRYFSLKSDTRPDLNWTRENVGLLMQIVADKLDILFPPNNQPGKAVKMTAFFKLVPKDES